MFFNGRKSKEVKENEARLRRINEREVRYVSTRDQITNVETIIGKYGIIRIEDNILSIICNEKVVFSHSVQGLDGSELMSLDGIILGYKDEKTGEKIEVIAYYKYYRK